MLFIKLLVHLTLAEVSNADVESRVNENVVGFEVTMNDPAGMDVL